MAPGARGDFREVAGGYFWAHRNQWEQAKGTMSGGGKHREEYSRNGGLTGLAAEVKVRRIW